ncbi:MAG: bifunctional diaminohydroxyphosphoribosylaminopyrimidine deaminase/5-amino-6-(5-phosphoribosylamino)uracil reductase RibD [Planctomycetes bacterium]|nr:bifunctional diaminohydroxyphosphoribosylaminopyrimidine deaminase/5-amino-6-(5-phosphoribosylamino)uracil reductase RibD [Planctomycetota bacterium]
MDDVKYMQRAIELAAKGIGNVEPNPAVGCVIVKNNAIIGEGYHEKFGAAHAEVNAIADCSDPEGATMYVTLEPCSHVGKTGPCADAVIAAKIARVVIASKDPSDHVGGRGIEKLTQAGIEVVTGVCCDQAKMLTPWFFKFAETKTPWVILKWAQSADGYMAYKDTAKHGQWISNEASRKDVHALRRSVQAILVGINTVIEDDPQLTPRPADGRELLRIVLDSNLRIPSNSNLLDCHEYPTLIVTTQKAIKDKPDKVEAILDKSAEVFIAEDKHQKCNLTALLSELGKRKVNRLLIEGGSTTITAFIEQKLADQAIIYIAPKTLGDKGTAEISKPMQNITQKEARRKELNGDTCIIARLSD